MSSSLELNISKKELELKVNWKLSRNETKFKNNFFISISKNGFDGLGEVAPNIRYNETPERILEEFKKLKNQTFNSIEEFKHHLESTKYCHSFKFGCNMAATALQAQLENKSIEELFELDSVSKIPTSFSVPIMEESRLKDYLKSLERFSFIKIKVNKDNASSFVKEISSLTQKPLRVDGNEAWNSIEDYLNFEKSIEDLNIQFIEQPFPSSMVDEYKKLRPISKFQIMADESIESDVDMEKIADQFHSVNIKLMKASSFENAIKLIERARKYGLKVMIGCMIETSLGISGALRLASLADYFDLDGSLLLQNDPYEFIYEKDGFIYLKD